jgi:hypothetical protein
MFFKKGIHVLNTHCSDTAYQHFDDDPALYLNEYSWWSTAYHWTCGIYENFKNVLLFYYAYYMQS